MKSLAILVLASFLSAFPACSGESADRGSVLRYTAIPSDGSANLAVRFGPLTEHLSKVLGVAVEYVPTTDYSASVETFVNGDVQLAWFGGLTGVQARKDVPGARAIAQGKVDPEYRSYFIANRESGLLPEEIFPVALEGKKFTFGSATSTSGRLMPEHFIRKFTGRPPKAFFGREMSFSGSHEKTAMQVASGAFDAGAIDYKTYDRLVAEGKIDQDVCYVIWRTPDFPDYNWTARPDLDEMFGDGFVDRLQRALVALDRPECLEAINRPEGLIPAENEEWDDLEKLATELGLLK